MNGQGVRALHVAEAAQIRNDACHFGVASKRPVPRSAREGRRARRLGSTLLALLTFLFVASAQVAAVRAELTDDASVARASACTDNGRSPAFSGVQREPAAYRRDVATAPAPVLDASESERSEEHAHVDDATVRPAQVRSPLPRRACGAAPVASATWVARLSTCAALPRGPPVARS